MNIQPYLYIMGVNNMACGGKKGKKNKGKGK